MKFQRKNKTISKSKIFLILKIVGIYLVAVLALGLIGSLFTGNSGGDDVRVPTVNRPSSAVTEDKENDVTESTVPDVPEEPSENTTETESESETETETVSPVSNYRVNVDGVYVGDQKVASGTVINNYLTFDLNDYPLTTTDCPEVRGWFMAESGVSEYYYYIFYGENHFTRYISYTGANKSPSQNDGAYLTAASNLGLSAEALKGCSFNAHTFDMSYFAGQTVNMIFYAKTNDGRDIQVFTMNNIHVPELPDSDEGSSGEESVVPTSNYSVSVNCVTVNGEFVSTVSTVNEPLLLDWSDSPLNSALVSPVLSGDFLVENGVLEYYYEVDNGETVSNCYTFRGTGNVDDYDVYKNILKDLGLSAEALNGCDFSGRTFDMSNYAGQTVDLILQAKTNDGAIIHVLTLNNVHVPELS